MHFEVLVEGQSGGIALESILEQILGANGSVHTWRVITYRGLGHVPRDLHRTIDPSKRHLLNQWPRLLRGYGRSLSKDSVVVVIVDLDARDCMTFKCELLHMLSACNPRPRTLFRIAIEESEAWLLDDQDAVRAAYPDAKASVLRKYKQDSICGTWELLADAVYKGGALKLKQAERSNPGKAKCEWAQKIAPYMDTERNRSKSFQVFRDGVRRLALEGQT